MSEYLYTEKILLTNIQRFSLHDGPGIRTTVFLKGCSIRCPWCSNPENLETKQQIYSNGHIKDIYGKYMTCDEVYEIITRDKFFYNNYMIDDECLGKIPGGVTFSGGEALLQANNLIPLFERLKREKIHMALETSLFVSSKQLEIALQYIDLFYVDVKIMDSLICQEVLKGNLEIYLENIEMLMNSGKQVIFRVPIIKSYTDSEYNKKRIIDFLTKYKPLKVELLKGHNFGEKKYESLGLIPPVFQDVSVKEMEEYKEKILKLGVVCEICQV